MAKKRKKKRSKNLGFKIVLIIGILVFLLFLGYKSYFGAQIAQKSTTIYITPSTTIDQLLVQLSPNATHAAGSAFKNLVRFGDLTVATRAGAYFLPAGTTAARLFYLIKKHRQSEVKFTFNNVRTVEGLASHISKQLMPDSVAMLRALQSVSITNEVGFTPQTIPALFLPDTYRLYWAITPVELLQRMKREYELFWNDKRKAQASSLHLTPIEVSTLASIVEEETNIVKDMSMISGLYLNRLRRGMPMQACPTIKFALNNFELQRIMQEHLLVNSPYNTYKNKGLPPGPIRIPSKKAIDAVLHTVSHNYLYMCAKSDFSGGHSFAATLDEHNRNAARYHRELNKRNILK